MVKLGVKRLWLYPNYRRVDAIVSLEIDEESRLKDKERIVLYGDNNQRLGVVCSYISPQDKKKFRQMQGKPVGFLSEKPTKSEKYGRVFHPHTGSPKGIQLSELDDCSPSLISSISRNLH